MVKKLFNFLPVKKGRSMKKRGNKKGSLLNRVLHYLKSDNYMFAPLFSSKNPSVTTSFEEIEYSKNEPKKLVEKVKDYLVSDCYMYAPLVLKEPWLRVGVQAIEHSKNESKKLVDRVKEYMVSDCYMYAPLVSDKSWLRSGAQEIEYNKNESKKLVDKVKEYMVSDCYMYAPLVLNEPWLRAGSVSSTETAVGTNRQGDATKSVTEDARGTRQNIKSNIISDQHVSEYPHTRKIIKATLLQRETVNHVIQQNGLPPSAKGGDDEEKRGGKRAKINGCNNGTAKRRRKVAGK